MKNLLKVIIFTLFTINAFAGPGDEVVNGASIAENNFIFSYINIERYLHLCLGSDVCHLEPTETLLLEKILAGLPGEYAIKSQLKFKFGHQDPTFFSIDGETKIARTGSRVGEAIWINKDLIYSFVGSGPLIPVSIERATAILVHEFGHHHGVLDHNWLDALGVKVERAMSGLMEMKRLRPDYSQVTAISIGYPSERSFSQFLVTDIQKIVDLSRALKETGKCRKSDETLVGLNLFNLHWSWRPGGTMKAVGEIIKSCQDANGVIQKYDQNFLVTEIGYWENDSKEILIETSQIKISQVDCSDKGSDCDKLINFLSQERR